MSKHLCAVTALTLFLSSLYAQSNLVRNPSFEETNTCAIGQFGGLDTIWHDNPITYRTAPFWISPNNESPDYYNACQSDGGAQKVPRNWQGYQFAKQGSAYMGIAAYTRNQPFYPKGEFREYIQTQLREPLEKGAVYRGRMFISPTYVLTDKFNAVAINTMAMGITEQQPLNDQPSVNINPISHATIFLQPSITDEGSIFRDTGSWHQICGFYKAKGGEQWLTIGNFRPLSQTDTVVLRPATDSVSNGISLAYYYIDDVSLIKVSDPIFPKRDTAVCQFPATLSATAGFDRYEWSTGDTTRSIIAPQPGLYWVKVSLSECGEVYDTIRVTQVANSILHIRDTVVCPAALPLSVKAQSGLTAYAWSTGATGPQASISAAGEYSVQAASQCGVLRDTFQVVVLEHVPDFDLGPPVSMCQNDQDMPVELAPSVDLPIYQWSTGEQTKRITVNTPGQYRLRSFNVCEEKQEVVTVSGCPAQVYIPNVFSPNDDGENDVFTVYARNARSIMLSVYDRWGNLVFQETGDALNGWNGQINGQPAPEGVFIYSVSFWEEGKPAIQWRSGDVTLMR